jgi:hypothetical protein
MSKISAGIKRDKISKRQRANYTEPLSYTINFWKASKVKDALQKKNRASGRVV